MPILLDQSKPKPDLIFNALFVNFRHLSRERLLKRKIQQILKRKISIMIIQIMVESVTMHLKKGNYYRFIEGLSILHFRIN